MSNVPEIVDYFDIWQKLPVFFTESPRRWEILDTQGNIVLSLKSIGVTGWPAQYEAVWAIKNG